MLLTTSIAAFCLLSMTYPAQSARMDWCVVNAQTSICATQFRNDCILFSDGVEYCSDDSGCKYDPAGVCVENYDETYSMLVCGLEAQIARATFNSSDCSGDALDLVDYISRIQSIAIWSNLNYNNFTVTCGCDARCDYGAARVHDERNGACDATDKYFWTDVTVVGVCQITNTTVTAREWSCVDGVLTGVYCERDGDDLVSETGCRSEVSLEYYEEITCGTAVDTHTDYGTPINYVYPFVEISNTKRPTRSPTSPILTTRTPTSATPSTSPTTPSEITVAYECRFDKDDDDNDSSIDDDEDNSRASVLSLRTTTMAFASVALLHRYL